jgi:arylsulfatase A-like enzyme
VLKTYEGILPGFQRVLAMPSTEFPEPWARWLETKGYRLPDNIYDLYYEKAENYPDSEVKGRTFAPAKYSKNESDTAFITDLALQFIRRPGKKPWFLHISYLRPHPPYLAPEPYNRMYHPDNVPACKGADSIEAEAQQHPYLALLLQNNLNTGIYQSTNYPRDEKSLRQLRATYYGLMTEVDDNIGKLIDVLKNTGQYDNTLIIFCSDHGDLLGDHYLLGKGSYFDKNVHVPLIIRSPDDDLKVAGGKTVEVFTENIDILPTVLELYGLDIPRQCDGRSLLPFLTGETPSDWRTAAHWEVDFRFIDLFPDLCPGRELGIAYDECCFNVIRDARYKYIHFTALPPLFFDLQNDPDELQNLAGDPAYAPLVLSYAQKMLSWRMTNDERTLTHLKVGPDGVVERNV